MKAVAMIAMVMAAAPAALAQLPPVDRVSPERLVIPIEGGGAHTVPIDWNHDPAVRNESVRHLVVMVHGYSRRNLFHEIFDNLLAGDPRAGEVAWYAPHFMCKQDLAEYQLGESYPYWSEGGWAIGHNSRSDEDMPRDHRISSFAVIDELVKQALAAFPNLESAVLGGFSAGGQFANRYAAGNRAHALLEAAGVSVRYVVASPSSYMYFCENRLVSRDPIRFGPVSETRHADCEGFHTYRLGTRGLNEYMSAVGPEKLAANYASRMIDYVCGGDDDERASRDLATGCGAMLQGFHRLDRMFVYREYLAFRFGADAKDRHRISIIPRVAHGSPPLFGNPAGRELLLAPWSQSSSQ